MSNIKLDKPSKEADTTITSDDDGFAKILLGQATLLDLTESGQASLKGDATVLGKLVATLVIFDEEFEIVPFSDTTVDANLYQQQY